MLHELNMEKQNTRWVGIGGLIAEGPGG